MLRAMLRTVHGASVAVLAGVMVAMSATPAAPAPQAQPQPPSQSQTERITLSSTGEQLQEAASVQEFSADGRYAVFSLVLAS